MHKRSPQSGFRHLPCVATCPSPGHVPSPRPRPRPVCPPSHAVDTYTRRRRHCAERSPHGGPLRRPQRRWRPCVSAHPLPLDNNRVPLAPGDLRGRPRRPRRRPHQRPPSSAPPPTTPSSPRPRPCRPLRRPMTRSSNPSPYAGPRQSKPSHARLRHAASSYATPRCAARMACVGRSVLLGLGASKKRRRGGWAPPRAPWERIRN